MTLATISTYRRTDSRHWFSDIFYLLAALSLFYLLWIGSYPLFLPDEGRYSEVAREMLNSGDYITPRLNGVPFLDKPILFYWLQAAAIHFLGIKEFALRCIPALFGVLGCLVTYIAGRHLYSRRTGLLSALILATAPLYFGLAHYANLDLEVAVLTTCTLFSFVIGIKSESRYRKYFLIATYVFSALAVLSKGLLGLALPILIIGAWITVLWRWHLLQKMHLLLGISLFLLISLPWYILVQNANPSFFHHFFIITHLYRFLSSHVVFNNEAPIWFYFPVVIIGFFPWIIFMIPALFKNLTLIFKSYQENNTELFLLLWIVIVFIFFSIPHAKIVSYIIPLFPPLALVIANYIDHQWNKISQNGLYSLSIAFLLLCVSIVLLNPYIHNAFIIPPALNPFLTILAIIFLASAFFVFLSMMTQKLASLVLVLTLCSISFLLTLTLSAKPLNNNSSKTLAMQIKPIIQTDDEIATYHKYYQDLPIYLERQIIVVNDWDSPTILETDNWQREFYYGIKTQEKHDFFINDDQFWKRWNSTKRIFVLTDIRFLDQFTNKAGKFYQLGQSNNTVLLVNQRVG
jgi:4-amino-4-deoxy-L-arabinose transferase-like glycosyltransferase